MEKNNSYRSYRYGDQLTPGAELKIEHSVYAEETDLSAWIAKGTEALTALRDESIQNEQKAFDIVAAAANQWEEQAAHTQVLNRALEYLRTPEVKHSGNQWEKTNNWRDAEEISNRVYRMSCSVWEDDKYDYKIHQKVPVWYVSWNLFLNSPKQGFGMQIAGQTNKRYTDKAAAMKYLEGRKKAYASLFTELSPPIPEKYAAHFEVYGTLLPGYTVEGREPVKTIPAATVSDGGISMPPAPEKASLLGKLTEAKEKAAPAVGNKMKKEDLQR